jgi:hypothetical protein
MVRSDLVVLPEPSINNDLGLFGVDGAILTENLIEPEFDEGRLTILYNS